MNKKIIVGICSIVAVLLIVLGAFFLLKKSNSDLANSDALKFKEEYESLNGTIRESDGELYNSIEISKDNPIKYINAEEALEVLDSKIAIIYIGANWCPWCRNSLPVMFDVAKKMNIDTIYYLNLDDDKSTFEIKDGKLEKVITGSDSYYKLLNKLSNYLQDYSLTDNDGKSYATGEKRIYMPFFITVKNGSVVEAHGITRELEGSQNKYSEMTDSQYEDLYKRFEEMFGKIYNTSGVCSMNNECN